MTRSLPPRFTSNLERLLPPGEADVPPHLLVAFSGGMDSTVLLHLLRFAAPTPLGITAAHFDHRMRPGSGEDVDWCRGLCADWDVPLIVGVAEHQISGEEEARSSRYHFLRGAAEQAGADWILTAHHADDQAETVLFRVLRGTGIGGLRGIPEKRPGLLRPLLPFWREELREYALTSDLLWREDPTNAGEGAARNRLRNTIIPLIEREIAPAARRSLVRLAEIAAESEGAWKRQVDEARARIVREERGSFLVARGEIAGYDPEIGLRLIRDVLRRLQSVPDRIGTRKMLQFITDAASGRQKELPGGVRVLIENDTARFYVAPEEARPDREWVIQKPEKAGAIPGTLILGGREFVASSHITAGADAATRDAWSFFAPLSELSFPLRVRARRTGDRIRLPGGTKSVKKLLIERRVPGSERSTTPVLVDSTGSVLWVSGIASAVLRTAAPGEPVLNLVLKK